jgi:hypothetical protein
MSLIFEMAIEKAAKEAMHKYLYNDSEGTSGGGYNDSAVLNAVAKRRDSKMSWMDFSDEELKIVNEVERNPGMKGDQIIKFMSVHNPTGTGVTCEAAVTKGLLSNLVKRKVLISNEGYTLNDSSTPPPVNYPSYHPNN